MKLLGKTVKWLNETVTPLKFLCRYVFVNTHVVGNLFFKNFVILLLQMPH